MNILDKERKLRKLMHQVEELGNDASTENLKTEIENYKKNQMTKLTAWDRVLIARHANRPTALDYITYMSPDFIELHGDRLYADDASIVGGIGAIDGVVFTIIGQQKGKSLDENMKRNFGMPNPEGFRKSLRLMKQAEKFRRPILTLIDTPGAYPGIGAEERGQGQAIARNLMEMSDLSVPVIAVVIGEGGSGGALALGFANKVLMLENAIYSILSPEGYASIVWKDASRAKEAAEVMKLTAHDLLEFGMIDFLIKEPIGGAHFDVEKTFKEVKHAIMVMYRQIAQLTTSELLYQRNTKFRNFGFLQRFNYDNLGGVKR